MPNVLQRSAEKVTDSLSGPFHQARIVLTMIYVALLAIILVFASSVTYSMFSSRLTHRFARIHERVIIERTFELPNANDVRLDLLRAFVVVNSFLLAFAGAASYWLAGLTLRPIQQAYQRQRQFIGDASHELRTPLAILRMEIDNELAKNPSAEVRSALQSKSEEVDRMTRLVTDLLALSRIDESEGTVDMGQVDLAETAKATCERLDVLAKQHGVALSVVAPDAVAVKANADLLAQAITNVVKNAILYNKTDGAVTVQVVREKDAAVCRVTDTGIGIPAEDVPHVFDRFYRAEKSRARGKGGSGLGLAIVQSIMELFDGAALVESEEGKGTVVTLKMPIHKASR